MYVIIMWQIMTLIKTYDDIFARSYANKYRSRNLLHSSLLSKTSPTPSSISTQNVPRCCCSSSKTCMKGFTSGLCEESRNIRRVEGKQWTVMESNSKHHLHSLIFVCEELPELFDPSRIRWVRCFFTKRLSKQAKQVRYKWGGSLKQTNQTKTNRKYKVPPPKS